MRFPVRLRSWWHALRHRVGRRGLFLSFLAVLDFTVGYFLLSPPPGGPVQQYPFMPHQAWGAAWLAVGVACAYGMFLKSDRVPYALAALLQAAWALRYAYLWYLGITPYAWVSVVIWLAFAFTVLVVAGWPEEVIILPPEARK